MARRAHDENQRAMPLRKQVKPPELAKIRVCAGGVGQPSDKSTQVRGSERLLQRPAALARGKRLDENMVGKIEPGFCQDRRVGQGLTGRRFGRDGLREARVVTGRAVLAWQYPYAAASGVGQLREGWQQQAQLTNARVINQQFHQLAARPALARQFPVEGGKTGAGAIGGGGGVHPFVALPHVAQLGRTGMQPGNQGSGCARRAWVE